MSNSSLTTANSDTPWWHETPSLASQTTYSQSTFAGASISQLTNPFSDGDSDRGSQSNGDSDEEGGRSFLIPSIDTNTGQSLGTVFDSTFRQNQKQFPSGKYSFTASSAENTSTYQSRLGTFSDSSNQQPRTTSSLPRSLQQFKSGSVADIKSTTEDSRTGSKEAKSDWLNRGKSTSWRGDRNSKKDIKEEKQVQPGGDNSSGVFNVTLKCQIHLHSENGDLKRSSSNIELVPAPGTNLPIILPGSVTMAPGVNPDKDPVTIHSPITEEESTDLSGFRNQDRTNQSGEDAADFLTPTSLSSDESSLSHSMSSANQDILNYLWPQFMQYLNPVVLVPVLTQHNLLTNEDLKFLSHPLKTDKERRRRILYSAPVVDFDLFVECISSEKSDSGHVYLARRLREAFEKKRNNPFKRLSSLRGKERGVSNKPTPLSLIRDKHSPHNSATPSPRTPTKAPPKTSTPSKKKGTGKTSTSEPFHPIFESVPLQSEDNDGFSYESSTLPRRFGSDSKEESRGTRPYSSARYTSSTSSGREAHSRRSKVTRHGSFQGASDGHVKVTPLLRDPNKLSQENSDVLENLTHFKTTVFQFPPTSQEKNEYSYQSMMSDAPFSNSQAFMGSEHLGGRDSLRRGKKTSDPSQCATIHEDIAESAESPDVVPPSLPVKKRRSSFSSSDAKKKYTNVAVSRFSSNATPYEVAKRQQTTPTHTGSQQNLDSSSGSERPRHSSLRKETPKQPNPLKRGSSMYGVTESPSRHYPLTKYDGYMPSALSPLPSSPTSPGDEIPPPVPMKQRTHRRTQSYDTSQTSIDFITFPTPQHTRPPTQKHSSLRRDITPSSMSIHGNTSNTPEVPSHVPIISTQDSGITSSFDRHALSVSSYSLSTDVGSSASKYSGATALDPASEALTVKRFEWLQEKVRFKKTPEEIAFSSRTHFNQERMILNSGVLYEHSRPKFLVLLTDMLLILKPRKRASALPGRLGAFFSSSQGPVLDWFSDMDCVAKMPLMLHHLSVRSLSKRKEPQVLYLHYDNNSEMLQFTLRSVSREAKDIWVDSLNSAIVACTKAQASTVLPVGNQIRREPTSSTYTKLTLTIVEANNVAVEVDAKTRDHFCSVQLGDKRCKTPSVQAQCWPTWNYRFEFVDFSLTEIVFIEFYTERITSPDEYLGGVDIQLMAVAQRLKVNMSQGVSTLQLKNQHLPLKNGKGTLTLDFELGWVTKDNK